MIYTVLYTVAVSTLSATLSSLSSPLPSPTTMLPFTTQPTTMPLNRELTTRDLFWLCSDCWCRNCRIVWKGALVPQTPTGKRQTWIGLLLFVPRGSGWGGDMEGPCPSPSDYRVLLRALWVPPMVDSRMRLGLSSALCILFSVAWTTT